MSVSAGVKSTPETIEDAEGRQGGPPGRAADLAVRDAALGSPLRPSRLDAARRRGLAAADVLAVAVAYAAFVSVSVVELRPKLILVLAASLPLWIVMNKLLGLYDRDPTLIDKSTLNELPRIGHSVLLGSAGLYLAAPLLPTGLDVGRVETLIFLATVSVAMPAFREMVRAAIRRTHPPERALIAGSGTVATLMARKIHAHPEYGIEVVGCIDGPSPDEYPTASAITCLGTLGDLDPVARKYEVERLIIAFSAAGRAEPLLDAIREAKLLNLKITMVPRLYQVLGSALEIDQVEGMVTLGMRSSFRSRSSLALKRIIDVTLAGAALAVLAPLMLACALAIKLTSRGPVLYRQQRIGRGSVPFSVLKFRTMVDGADALKPDLLHLNEAAGPMFKMAEDPRVTRVGGFLRKTSMDELPQLINVMRGQMSLVGPRPLVPDEDGAILGRYRSRLDLTPGLTGPWQVHGRTRIPFDEMVELDYLYVADWSLWNDFKLLVRTVPVVAFAKGH